MTIRSIRLLPLKKILSKTRVPIYRNGAPCIPELGKNLLKSLDVLFPDYWTEPHSSGVTEIEFIKPVKINYMKLSSRIDPQSLLAEFESKISFRLR